MEGRGFGECEAKRRLGLLLSHSHVPAAPMADPDVAALLAWAQEKVRRGAFDAGEGCVL